MLGHAFAPPIGAVHFDDDEYFSHGVNFGVNLLWLATHELGHALGLPHSSVVGSVMYPYYGGYRKKLQLQTHDVQSIQALYGKPGLPSDSLTLLAK